jgi:hypothetical protein
VSLEIQAIQPHPAVRRKDRLWDISAAALLVGGMILFVIGRQALNALSEGSYPAPNGESWVSRADLHAAQTRWGIWLVLSGVAVGLLSAVRHALHRRSLR